jgi:hypothetical protein
MSLLTPAQEANARSVLSNVRSGIDAIKASNPMLSSQPNVSTNPSLNNTGVTPTASTNVQSNAPDFTMPKRDVVPSSSLIGGLSLSEILDTRKQLQRQVLEANKPTQNELDLTDQLNATKKLSRDAQVEYRRQEERLLGQGGATREQTTPFISETAKSYQRSLADVGTSQSGLADLLEAEINKRKSNVDYATGLLNADKDNISMLQDLQKSTRPDVLNTQVNDLTGDVTAFIQDPTTGTITSQNIGNVGAKKQYVQSGTYQDSAGNQVFWGMNPSGQIETKMLGGGGSGGNGLSGGYTSKQITAISKINQDVSKNATYAKTSSMRNYGDNVLASLSLGNGIADISAINQFQKVIDEGAVTRDQDVKLISSAQSLANSLKTKIKKLEAGDQLSPDQRTQMRSLVENLYDAQVKALLKDPYISAKNKEADLNGIDPVDTILGELSAFQTTQQPQQNLEGQTKEWQGKTYKVVNGVWTPQESVTTPSPKSPMNTGGFNSIGINLGSLLK